MTHAGTPLPLSLGITVVSAALTGIAWRYRDRPGGRPFVGIMAMITFQAFWVVVDYFVRGRWPVGIATIGGFTMTAVWLLFVLEYVGHERFLNRYTLAAVSVGPVFVTAVAVVHLVGLSPRAVFPRFLGLLLPLHFLGTIVLGNLLLLKFVLTENRLYTDQSLALVVGMAAPFVGYVFNNVLTRNPLPGDAVLISLSVTGLAFAFALYRFELFSVLPVTQQIGRDAAVDDLDDGVLIVDPTGQVVDVNEAGAAIFGRPPSSLVGEPVGDVFGEQAPADAGALAPEEYRTGDGSAYSVAVSEITNRADRHVGWTVVFRDVTYRELRETQLEVLNRVLRHNLRNKLSTVQGHAEILSERIDEEDAEFVERQLAATRDLMEIGERAREFEQLETRDQVSRERVDVATLVEGIVSGLAAEYPDVEVAVDLPADLEMETYPNSLEIVLENLLWNAAEHGSASPRPPVREDAAEHGTTDTSAEDGAPPGGEPTPAVELSVAARNGDVEFVVSDDGPGIPDEELAVLAADTETALDHGSGMGLWITKWGVQYLGGDLAFETDGAGTTATVTVPRTAAGSGGPASDPSTSP